MPQKTRRSPDRRSRHTVLIVDDHPIVRQGLAQLIDQETDLQVCGQAEDAHEAMQAIGTLHPDMVIVDISLKNTSGMELIKDLKVQHPDLPVLTLSMHDEADMAEKMLTAGAVAYLNKAGPSQDLLAAIRG